MPRGSTSQKSVDAQVRARVGARNKRVLEIPWVQAEPQQDSKIAPKDTLGTPVAAIRKVIVPAAVRNEIAALKRRVTSLERHLLRGKRSVPREPSRPSKGMGKTQRPGRRQSGSTGRPSAM